MQLAIISTLLLLLCSGTLAFVFDARLRRQGNQIAIAIPFNSTGHKDLSLRRTQVRRRLDGLHRLVAYNSHVDYALAPPYVVLIAIIIGAALVYLGPFAGLQLVPSLLMGLAAGVLAARGLFGWQQNRFTTRLFRQLPDALELVNSTVRAGLPIAEAFRVLARDMPAPTAGQFALVCDDIRFGRSASEAVENVYRRTHVQEYAIFAVTLAVQLQAGGSLAGTLQTLGDTVRQRVALAARAKALAGEVIFSAKALTVAPFIFGGLLYLLNPQMEDKLFTDPTGRLLMACALISVFFGAVVIYWMVKRETKP
ncbi:MAG TPA: type II secretion system F family protein [Acetobacteraceae bacterium]|jgi:tight adherence protein B|nr:type II secretion system F family protein [Acetobacteraceae bacterium]